MSTFEICYDLRQPGRNYSALHKAIESYGTYYHCLESTWIVRTDSSATQIRDYLLQFVDSNDAVLVTKLAGEAAWYGIVHSDWLQRQLAA